MILGINRLTPLPSNAMITRKMHIIRWVSVNVKLMKRRLIEDLLTLFDLLEERRSDKLFVDGYLDADDEMRVSLLKAELCRLGYYEDTALDLLYEELECVREERDRCRDLFDELATSVEQMDDQDNPCNPNKGVDGEDVCAG